MIDFETVLGCIFLVAIVIAVFVNYQRERRIIREGQTDTDDKYSTGIYLVIENIIYAIGILLSVVAAAYDVYLAYFHLDKIQEQIINEEIVSISTSVTLSLFQPFIYCCLVAAAGSVYSIFAPNKKAMLIAAIAMMCACIAQPMAFDNYIVPTMITLIAYLCRRIKA